MKKAVLAPRDAALFRAIRQNDAKAFEKALKNGANVNARDYGEMEYRGALSPTWGEPAIFAAIKQKNLAFLKALISRGANVNAVAESYRVSGIEQNPQITYPQEFSTLDFAAFLNSVEMLEILGRAGAKSELDAEDFNYQTPQVFRIAATKNAVEAMRFLLSLDDENKEQHASASLIWAIYFNHPEMVSLLMENGADKKSAGEALVKAIESNQLDNANALIEGGAQLDTSGYGPLVAWLEKEEPRFESVDDEVSMGYPLFRVFRGFHKNPEDEKYARDAAAEFIAEQKAKNAQRDMLLQKLFTKGANLNYITPSGYTPFLLALEIAEAQTVRMFLEHGAKANWSPAPFASPLRFLCANGRFAPMPWNALKASRRNAQIAQLLIENGAQVQSGDGAQALGEAARNGHLELVEILLRAGANPNAPFTSLPYTPSPKERGATASKEEAQVAEREWQGQIKSWGIVNFERTSALSLAARGGHINEFRALLQAGADATLRDAHGQNALHYLASQGRSSTFLNPSIVPTHELPALVKRASLGDAAIARELILAGCSPLQSDKNGQTPLKIALLSSDPSVVETLLKAGAKAQTNDLFSLLEKGRRQNALPISLENLQEHWVEADRIALWYLSETRSKDYSESQIRAKAIREKAIATYAQAMRFLGAKDAEIAGILVRNGANINARNNAGLSPLMLAARTGQLEVVRVLLRNGADKTARNRAGESLETQISRYGIHTQKRLWPREKLGIERQTKPNVIAAREKSARWLLRRDSEAILQLLRGQKL